jgi:hypothetical protein
MPVLRCHWAAVLAEGRPCHWIASGHCRCQLCFLVALAATNAGAAAQTGVHTAGLPTIPCWAGGRPLVLLLAQVGRQVWRMVLLLHLLLEVLVGGCCGTVLCGRTSACQCWAAVSCPSEQQAVPVLPVQVPVLPVQVPVLLRVLVTRGCWLTAKPLLQVSLSACAVCLHAALSMPGVPAVCNRLL